MNFLTSLFIALGLAMDAFAVSLSIGTTGQADDRSSKFRLAFHFGIFQAGMTLAGWLLGSTVAHFIDKFDHWLAFALLLYVGINMIRSGFDHTRKAFPTNPSKGRFLVILSVATSLDALAVGLSMAFLGASVYLPALIIGLVAFVLSALALLAGTRLGEKFGKRVEILGGLILLAIGVKILIEHLG